MCKVSDKIKFCTCATKSTADLKNYWVLHRFDNKIDNYVIGEVILSFLEKELDEYNSKFLLKRFNDKDAFDFDLNPKDKDRLQISFSCKEPNAALNYGFSYSKGKWKEESFYPLEWMWKHEKREFGKLKYAIDNRYIRFAPLNLKGHDWAAFLKAAMFVHSLIIEGESEKAKKRFPDVFDFANSYAQMDHSKFNDLLSKELDRAAKEIRLEKKAGKFKTK